jgi:hypothetical protein
MCNSRRAYQRMVRCDNDSHGVLFHPALAPIQAPSPAIATLLFSIVLSGRMFGGCVKENRRLSTTVIHPFRVKQTKKVGDRLIASKERWSFGCL